MEIVRYLCEFFFTNFWHWLGGLIFLVVIVDGIFVNLFRIIMAFVMRVRKPTEAPADLPHWRRAEEDKAIGCIVWDESRNFHLYMDRVEKGQLFIPIYDVLTLPDGPKAITTDNQERRK